MLDSHSHRLVTSALPPTLIVADRLVPQKDVDARPVNALALRRLSTVTSPIAQAEMTTTVAAMMYTADARRLRPCNQESIDTSLAKTLLQFS